MRVVMIHALAESVSPVKVAFGEVFPEAELINLLDEALFVDFKGQITPQLRRRMSQLICYCEEYGADAIGLACSVYAPVVETAKDLVEVPVVSSYSPVMEEAVKAGKRIGIVASVGATLRDSDYYLQLTAEGQGRSIETELCFAEELIPLHRTQGEEAFNQRLEELVLDLSERVDAVLLGQFSMASALNRLQEVCPVPVLSGPHSSANKLKELLSVPVWPGLND
ncbi:MAG: aspartate/glutamate racemase family protein [Chloroflexi bacterium]|nr:aspartate/glutamate racemase family protein [Chloroflexota bacterium]